MDDFYPAFLHYAVAMRLFEDTCRQLRDFEGGAEEGRQLVDETLRLSSCVLDNIDDVESLLSAAAREAANDPALSEALSLISNNLREDRARADSYYRHVSNRRLGGGGRAPRRPQVANPFLPLVSDGGYEEGEDNEGDAVRPGSDGGVRRPLGIVPDEEGYEDNEDDEEADEAEDEGYEDNEDDEDADEDGDGGPEGEGEGDDYDEDGDLINEEIVRFLRPRGSPSDGSLGGVAPSPTASGPQQAPANPLAEETHRLLSEHGRDPEALAGHVQGDRVQGRRAEAEEAPPVERRAVPRPALRRTVRRRWRSRSCSLSP